MRKTIQFLHDLLYGVPKKGQPLVIPKFEPHEREVNPNEFNEWSSNIQQQLFLNIKKS